jgi:hypothetical protein
MLQHGTEQPPVTCSNSPGSSPIRTTRIQSDSECILECIVNGTSLTTQNVGSASPAWKESDHRSSPPPTIVASWCAIWCAMRVWSSLVPVTHGCRLGIGCDCSTVESDRPLKIDKPKYIPFQCSALRCASEFVAETRSTELERERNVSVETFARCLLQHGSSRRGARLVKRSRRRGREDERPEMTPHTREKNEES